MIDDMNEEVGVPKVVRNTSLIASITWLSVVVLVGFFVVKVVYSKLDNELQEPVVPAPPPPPPTLADLVILDGQIAATESALAIKTVDMEKRIISRQSDRDEFDRLNRELLNLRNQRATLAAHLQALDQMVEDWGVKR